mmetsp:Transcript_29265/g.31923  ORF Transcript_29265/g.31923 Transcript_29265/m.31923 type:complete len:99 (+) Transcript_29265:160-456(+)
MLQLSFHYCLIIWLILNIQGILLLTGASEHIIVRNLYFPSVIPVILGNIFYWFVFVRKCPISVSIPFGVDAPTCFFIGYAMLDVYNKRSLKDCPLRKL